MASAAATDVQPLEARAEAGRDARSKAPRSAHAHWSPPEDRPDPLAILEEQERTRVPSLVPIRHGRMAASPLAFLRGAAAVMAWDLSRTPSSGLMVQACGDAHLENFGVFAAPDRRLVFDLNDFDETHPGPFEWDLMRLAASVVVAALGNGHRPRDARAAALATARTYRERMADAASMRSLDIWYTRLDVDQIVKLLRKRYGSREAKGTEKEVAKARRHTQLGTLDRFCDRGGDGAPQIREAPPLIVRLTDEEHGQWSPFVVDALESYLKSLAPDRRMLVSRYHFADFAWKVVGVGSVGTAAFMVLFMGDRDDDPLFLQAKEAERSVLSPYVRGRTPKNQGQRVVEGQRLIQAASDPFLGWLRGSGPEHRDFYMRQLRDMKGSANIESMDPEGLRLYGEICATALARAHARTGDPVAIASYLGSSDRFDTAIASFAVDYADQTKRDHEALLEAIDRGRMQAEMGV
jgi:uncharacterized protein (DUF2252 family)